MRDTPTAGIADVAGVADAAKVTEVAGMADAAAVADTPDSAARSTFVGAPGAMIVIISGPSGVGKDTILEWLKKRPATPERHFVVTYKTRAPRPGEIDGIHYQFVDEASFRQLLERGRLLEASSIHGHWSGSPRDQVELALAAGRDAILKIDVHGAEDVKALAPGALRIFVAPPSLEALHKRLSGRGTETAGELERRRRDAETEMEFMPAYDHVVINETGEAEKTARRIDRIIKQEHARHPRRRTRL